jgi:hypothetical protein
MNDAHIAKLVQMLADANRAATDAYLAWERSPSDLLRSDYRAAALDEERIEALLADARRAQKGTW